MINLVADMWPEDAPPAIEYVWPDGSPATDLVNRYGDFWGVKGECFIDGSFFPSPFLELGRAGFAVRQVAPDKSTFIIIKGVVPGSLPQNAAVAEL